MIPAAPAYSWPIRTSSGRIRRRRNQPAVRRRRRHRRPLLHASAGRRTSATCAPQVQRDPQRRGRRGSRTRCEAIARRCRFAAAATSGPWARKARRTGARSRTGPPAAARCRSDDQDLARHAVMDAPASVTTGSASLAAAGASGGAIARSSQFLHARAHDALSRQRHRARVGAAPSARAARRLPFRLHDGLPRRRASTGTSFLLFVAVALWPWLAAQEGAPARDGEPRRLRRAHPQGRVSARDRRLRVGRARRSRCSSPATSSCWWRCARSASRCTSRGC